MRWARTGCSPGVTRRAPGASPTSARSRSRAGDVLRVLTPGGGGWGPSCLTSARTDAATAPRRDPGRELVEGAGHRIDLRAAQLDAAATRRHAVESLGDERGSRRSGGCRATNRSSAARVASTALDSGGASSTRRRRRRRRCRARAARAVLTGGRRRARRRAASRSRRANTHAPRPVDDAGVEQRIAERPVHVAEPLRVVEHGVTRVVEHDAASRGRRRAARAAPGRSPRGRGACTRRGSRRVGRCARVPERDGDVPDQVHPTGRTLTISTANVRRGPS